MSIRMYAIQIHSATKGWRDLPEEISFPKDIQWIFKKQHEAINAAKEIVQNSSRCARVIRKPKGWEAE